MVRIISDSTCDLSPMLLSKYNITIIPLNILLGDKEYADGADINPDRIYQWSEANRTTPKTSAPSIERAIQCMKPILDRGDELICFSISESMSSSANTMRLAAAELEKEDMVTVINSENLSTGIGLLVIEAAIMAADGMERDKIKERILQLIPLVRTSFVVDTMVYLKRGGRCSAVTALAGSALRIHPEIIVSDGGMTVGKKYRGKADRVIMRYAEDLKPLLLHGKKDRVFITHSGCSREILDEVKEYLLSLDYFDEILESRAGSVISSHCGPGTLGIIFIDNPA